MEERLIDIEIKIANQENLIDQLNSVVFEQQKKIDLLEKILRDQLRTGGREIGPFDVKPPHY